MEKTSKFSYERIGTFEKEKEGREKKEERGERRRERREEKRTFEANKKTPHVPFMDVIPILVKSIVTSSNVTPFKTHHIEHE